MTSLSLPFGPHPQRRLLAMACLFLTWSTCHDSLRAQAQEAAPAAEAEAKAEARTDSTGTRDLHELAAPLSRTELVEAAQAARARGLDFLLKNQNKDGSWGSHDPKIANLADFGFQLRNRGSQDGVRIACTAICATVFLEAEQLSDEQRACYERAIEALLSTDRFAYHKGEAFNTWGYGYKLDFLTRFLETEAGKKRRDEVEAAARVCIEGLRRYQQVDGGWNYYAGPIQGGESMSFNTANFAIALMRAERLGMELPKGMASDAVKLLRRMRTRRGGFVYDARFLHDPGSVNELSSASRTVICALALHMAGHFREAELRRSMEVFDEGENYLEDGRKLIQPHTAVHQISGYFFFYGYAYAIELAELLGDQVEEARWDRFAWTMLRTQEEDGCWWDTAAANYGDKWGTGFALLVLQRFLKHAEQTNQP